MPQKASPIERVEERNPLVEEQGHDDGHQHGIDEQDRRGDARIHEVVAPEQEERRKGEEQAHRRERRKLGPAQRERLPPREHQSAEQHDGRRIAVEEHRIDIHARLVHRQREERIESVAGGCDRSQNVTFDFRVVHNSGITAQM